MVSNLTLQANSGTIKPRLRQNQVLLRRCPRLSSSSLSPTVSNCRGLQAEEEDACGFQYKDIRAQPPTKQTSTHNTTRAYEASEVHLLFRGAAAKLESAGASEKRPAVIRPGRLIAGCDYVNFQVDGRRTDWQSCQKEQRV